jgi:cytochrome c556
LSVLVALALLPGLGLFLSFANAQEGENKPLLEYLQRIMAGQRASMASMGDILKLKMPYDASHFVVHAKNIGEFAKLIPDAFEKKNSREDPQSFRSGMRSLRRPSRR